MPPVRLLEELPALARHLDAREASAAREQAVARVVNVRRGPWAAEREYADNHSWIGLIVLDGLLLREIGFGRERSVELLGPGDLVRPWDHDGAYHVPTVEISFNVLEDATLALLDDEFVRRIARWPALIAGLTARAGLRARWLALRVALSAIPRVTTRVLFLFSHLADRFGRETADGILIPFDLTHSLLADLVGTRRPSITTALGELHRQGRLTKHEAGGWMLAPGIDRVIGDLIESDFEEAR